MSGRTSKWKRNRNPGRLILQARDREIVVSVYAFRFMTREQIEGLFGFGCTRRVNVRLRKLYDHGYLSRTYLPTIRGSAKALYYVGNAGVQVICEELGTDPVVVRRRVKQAARPKGAFLAHSLQVNEVRITLAQAIQDDDGLRVERWLCEDECLQEYLMIKEGKEILKRINPDGYLRFWCRGKLYSSFLELDRSTMSHGRFRRKVENYLEYARSGLYEEKFRVKYFRVLVITLTEERLLNLKKTVESVTDKIFWFTTLEQMRANNVLGRIWQKAGCNGFHSLIEM